MRGSWQKCCGGLVTAAAIGLALMPAQASAAPPVPGGTWAIQASPNQPGAKTNVLSGVSCVAGGTCVAVGSYGPGPNNQFPLAMLRTGTTWALKPVPHPAGVQISLLSGVSCATARFCVGVGYTRATPHDPNTTALLDRWNGTSWTGQAVPSPPEAILSAVSCPTQAYCLAVGQRLAGNGIVAPLAEAWNGTSWSMLAAPNRHAPNGSTFTGVDCVAANSCEVEATFGYGEGDQTVFAYAFNGTAWTFQKQRNHSFLGFEFNTENSVSCSSAAACTSVGFWQPGQVLGVIERWDGTSWAQERLPSLPKAMNDTLLGVSCTAAAACTAVGELSANLSNIPMTTLALTWNGTSWQRAATPSPAGRSSQLSAVSCTSATTCVAVGSSASGAASTTLVEVSAG
jgi:hypothetical protein